MMLSAKDLQGYAFFKDFDSDQRKAIGLIAKEEVFESGTTIFEEGQPAKDLYVLIEGQVDLYYAASREPGDQLLVAEIKVGEPFSLSALIAPGYLTATAKARSHSHVLKVNGLELRALCEVDPGLGYLLMRQAAQSVMERLHLARILLADAEKESRDQTGAAGH
jgi:CRP/FNR family cyclic AMP-dependent transcriptional regulator